MPIRPRSRVGLLLALSALLSPLCAQEPTPEPTLASLMARFSAAPNGGETAKRFRPEFEAFADQHRGSEDGLSARLWLLQQSWWLRTNDSSAAMYKSATEQLDKILAEYPDSPQFAKIADYHYVFSAAQKTEVFEKLLQLSKEAEVKAAMLLRLGMMEKNSRDETVKARGQQRLETLLKDYKDVAKGGATYGALADAQLHPLSAADLAVGKPAPEIVGTDTDGHAMKLSDFKGRVVVLDFWGFW
jgi:hypothetical protein